MKKFWKVRRLLTSQSAVTMLLLVLIGKVVNVFRCHWRSDNCFPQNRFGNLEFKIDTTSVGVHPEYLGRIVTAAAANGSTFEKAVTGSPEILSTLFQPDSIKSGCRNFAYTQGHWKANENQTRGFAWEVDDPNLCHLVHWNATLFCETLAGRSLLIVGDSLNAQFYRRLVRLLQGKSEPVHSNVTNFQVSRVCSGHLSISFIRNDNLIATKLESLPPQQQYNLPWMLFLKEKQVLYINTGAHAQEPSRHRTTLQAVMQHLRMNKTNTTYNGTNPVFFRTTPRGHIGCTLEDKDPIPSENHSAWTRFFDWDSRNKTGVKYFEYGYDRININNKIYRELLKPSQLMDVARIVELRPDGHHEPPRDCLHYKNQDIFDIWIQLLLNALLGKL